MSLHDAGEALVEPEVGGVIDVPSGDELLADAGRGEVDEAVAVVGAMAQEHALPDEVALGQLRLDQQGALNDREGKLDLSGAAPAREGHRGALDVLGDLGHDGRAFGVTLLEEPGALGAPVRDGSTSSAASDGGDVGLLLGAATLGPYLTSRVAIEAEMAAEEVGTPIFRTLDVDPLRVEVLVDDEVAMLDSLFVGRLQAAADVHDGLAVAVDPEAAPFEEGVELLHGPGGRLPLGHGRGIVLFGSSELPRDEGDWLLDAVGAVLHEGRPHAGAVVAGAPEGAVNVEVERHVPDHERDEGPLDDLVPDLLERGCGGLGNVPFSPPGLLAS